MQVGGNLDFFYTAITSAAFLGNITCVGGGLGFQQNLILQTLEGFNKLEQVNYANLLSEGWPSIFVASYNGGVFGQDGNASVSALRRVRPPLSLSLSSLSPSLSLSSWTHLCLSLFSAECAPVLCLCEHLSRMSFVLLSRLLSSKFQIVAMHLFA